MLAEIFAVATRLYSESAVCLATSGKSGSDFTRLSRPDDRDADPRGNSIKTLREHVASHQCGEGSLNGKGHLNAEEQHVP
jgi:hypothetical protein